MFVGCVHACSNILNVRGNDKAPISKVELFCLFVASTYTSMKATVLSCSYSWVWSRMPNVSPNKKLVVSQERVEWFCWFFASYLHDVRYPMKLRKCSFWLALPGMGSKLIRLPDISTEKNSKTILVVKLMFYM